MNLKNREARAAIPWFEKMEQTAQLLHDHVLLKIALTYHGDTLRRCNDLEQARVYLHTAYTLKVCTDMVAHGNNAQLLARVSLQLHDAPTFERLMKEAEALVPTLSPNATSVHGQYCLGTVYIEYARAYSKSGDFTKAVDYLDMAEKAFLPVPHWKTLLTRNKSYATYKWRSL